MAQTFASGHDLLFDLATKFSLDGLLLTVFLAGFMLTLIGLPRLGSLIRYIPHTLRAEI